MKRIFTLLTIVLCLRIGAQAQDLPANPDPNKCYVRCTTPDVYVNEEVQVLVTPEYNKLRVVPAEYKTVTEEVMVKAASKKLVVVPAKWETEQISYTKKQGAKKITVDPAKLSNSSETFEIKAKFAQWELSGRIPDCDSADPNDCKMWCYKGYPAEYETVSTKLLSSDASSSETPIDSRGTADNNRSLSERRAQAVSNYLISKGINPSRITSNGYGESRLMNRCSDGVSCTEREHRMNRRTQFRVIQ